MAHQERTTLASSFGNAATAYAEHRPDYCVDAVRWAIESAPGRRVLDLGAGTGKLTATLAALGLDVVAVEPDAAMLHVLGATVPEVRALAGSAEQIPLPEGSVDAVVAGNAMHWFDLARTAPEVARVLSPGGVLAGLWNVFDDRVGWVSELARISGDEAIGPRDTLTAWESGPVEAYLPQGDQLVGFSASERASFAHGQPRTVDSLLATLATKAGILVLAEHERAQMLSHIEQYLRGCPAVAEGEFVLPLRTGVLRFRSHARPSTSVIAGQASAPRRSGAPSSPPTR